MSWKTNAKVHFKNRVRERLGIEVSDDEYFDLCQKCQDRKTSRFIKFDECDQILEIKYKNFQFQVVYNGLRNRLVTVLPNSIKNV